MVNTRLFLEMVHKNNSTTGQQFISKHAVSYGWMHTMIEYTQLSAQKHTKGATLCLFLTSLTVSIYLIFPLMPTVFCYLSLAFICPSLLCLFLYHFILSITLSCPWLSSLVLCSVCSYYHLWLFFFFICLPSLLYLHCVLIYYRYKGVNLCVCVQGKVIILRKRGQEARVCMRVLRKRIKW